MSNNIAGQSFRSQPSRIPRRTGQALSQALDFEVSELQTTARPIRQIAASRSFERSLGQRWPNNPCLSLSPLATRALMDNDEESDGDEDEDEDEDEDIVPRELNEVTFPLPPVHGFEGSRVLSEPSNLASKGWDAPLQLNSHVIPHLCSEITSALATLRNRLENCRQLSFQERTALPWLSSGSGQFIDVFGLSQKVLADFDLPTMRDSGFEAFKSNTFRADAKKTSQVLKNRVESPAEILSRLLRMLQHIVETTRCIGSDNISRLRWTLNVRGELKLELELLVLGAPPRLILHLSKDQREKVLAFFGHPFS